MASERVTRLYLKAVLILALVVIGALTLTRKDAIPLGLDLRGGSELLYRIKHEDLAAEDREGITQRTIDVIRRRIDPQGNKEILMRAQGKHRFYLQLPGMGQDEARRIEDLIRRAGKLRFCLVNSDREALNRARQGEKVPAHTTFIVAKRNRRNDPERWRIARTDELAALSDEDAAGWLLVENRSHVNGDDLADVHATTDRSGFPAVGFGFKGLGRRQFTRLTDENIGKRLAIILDRELYSAPVIKSRIPGEGIIEGRFNPAEMEDLLAILRAGRLPADIELEWNNTVGPQLGEDSIRSGLRAAVFAMILVIAFMALYYLLTGLIANFAVMLNLLLVLMLMSWMHSVLTLPGIAGLVLTLGMAVDANVLINERIREEREKGKTLGLAIRNGYERAFVTILDSNLTTLITALILFGVGTGPVKGFALTLSFGIVISMFTSIWVTRVIIDLLVENGWLHTLKMLRLFRKPAIAFTRIRHGAMIASAILIVFGISMLVRGWDRIKDTDLSGGVRAEMQLRKGIPLGEFRKRLARIFPGKSDVQAVWEAGADQSLEHPRRFSIRVRQPDHAQRLRKMHQDFTRLLKNAGAFRTLDQGKILPLRNDKVACEFHARLSRPLPENTLRKLLFDAGYGETTIRRLLQVEPAASEFNLRLAPAAGDDEQAAQTPEQRITRVLDALKLVIASHDVRVKVARLIPGERSVIDPNKRESPDRLPITLAAKASVAAVRDALGRKIFAGRPPDDLRVEGEGADRGADICLSVAAFGSDDTLAAIAAAKLQTLPILSFRLPERGRVINILANAPLKEAEIRGRLSEAGILDPLVRSVVPLAAPGSQFILTMNELSDEKAANMIKEHLLLAFEDNLAREKVIAAVTPLATDPKDARVPLLKKQGYAFYTLALDPPVDLQTIRATLLDAGCKDALLDESFTAGEATHPLKETVLKLKGPALALEEARTRIASAFANPDPFRSVETIGSVVAGEMKNKAILAVLLSWIAIIFYIWFRFGEVKFGLAAVTALIHDVLMTAGAVGVADALSGTAIGAALGFSDIKINVTMIAAFLTLIGYSINDTIVVFDRIRENMGGARRRVDPALVDSSINQILSRTLLTSFTTFMVLIVLYIMGGPVIHGFAFVMTFGVLVGTYSSIFIASPILIGWENFIQGLRRSLHLITFRAAAGAPHSRKS